LKKDIKEMTKEELIKELEFVKECLLDEEEMHTFTMQKASVHIGASEATRIQDEHDEKCAEYREKIKKIEERLKHR
jgi:hypothetical protein